jgi:5-methylcytosine-specific restriction endonuclease McrA
MPKKIKSKKPKRINKARELKKLKLKADKLWSLYIRHRDEKCMLCGATEDLQAHHCIVRKALGNATRWHINNGISLCYVCHLIEIHRNATKSTLEKYLKILNNKYTKKQQEEVYSLYRKGIKIEYEDMVKIVFDLENKLRKILIIHLVNLLQKRYNK